MSGILYAIGLDNRSLLKDAKKSKSILADIGNKTVSEGKRIDRAFRNIANTVGGVFVLSKAQDFIGQVARVRGEFQQLEVALTTMLGSKSEADKLMAKTVDFAAKTPFDLQDVASGTKQLLAYGSVAETVTNELRMLGNISAGLSIPLNDMVYLYGTTRTQGRMYTQDLRQFMGRGIPIAEELAKILGVQKDEIQELVTAGKVGFPEVEKALRNMTNEGGKFYNLMEEQSKTITGKMSNLGDAVSQMLNEIGKSNEGVISDAIDGAGYLVENYEKIGKVIADLVVIYGSYKTALIAINVIERQRRGILVMVNQMAKVQMSLNKAITKQEAVNIVRKKLLTRVLWQQTKAQLSANAAILANPYVLVAGALAGLTYAVYKYATAESSAERATRLFNDEQKQQAEETEKAKQKFNDLIDTIKDETATRTQQQEAYEKLQKLYPAIFNNMDIETLKLAEKKGLLKEINEELENRNDLEDETKLEELKKQRKALDKKSYNISAGYSSISGGGASVLSLWQKNREIKELDEKIKVRQEAVNKKKRTKYNAWFNSLDNNGKIKELERKNEKLKKVAKLFEGSGLNPNASEIAKNLKEINRLRKEENEKIHKKKRGLQEVKKEYQQANKDVLKWQKALQKDTNNNEVKENLRKAKENRESLKKELANLGVSVKSNIPQKEKKTAEQLAEEKKATEERIAQKELQLEQQKQDKKFEVRQRGIDQEKDQTQKRIKQIELDYERQEAVIERNEQSILKKIRDNAKEKARAEHITKYGDDKHFTFDKSTISLPTEWKKIFDDLRQQNEDNKTNSTSEVYDNLLEKYKTYEQKKTDIHNKYKKIRNNLKGKEYDKKKLGQDEAKELFEVEKGAGKIKSTISLVFSDLSEKTKEELDKIQQKGEELYDALDNGVWNADIGAKFGLDKETFEGLLSPEILEALRKKLDELKVSSKSFADNFKNLFKENISDSEFSQSLSAVVGKIQTGIQALNMFSDALRSINELTGDDSFGDIADTISATVDVANTTMQGAQMGAQLGGQAGAIIGGALGFVTGVLNKSAEAEKRHREALKKLQQSNIQNQRVYNQLLFEQKMLMKGSENIFGVDELGKALEYLNLYNESYQKLQDKLKKKERVANFGLFTAKYQASDLDEIQIKTGTKTTGALWWKKEKAIYSSITKKHKDLIKANGEFDVAQAKSLLQTQEFGEGGKEALQEIITEYENMEKAQKQFDDYLRSTLGELGSGLMDSVIHSLKTGEDAFESFGKSVGNVMLKLGEDMFYSAYLKDYFDDLSDKIKKKSDEIRGKGGNETDLANGIKDVIAGSMGELKEKVNLVKGGLKSYIDGINKDLGIDIFDKEKQRQATQKGLVGMSQDTGSALDEKFTLSIELQRQSLDVAKEVSMGFKTLQVHSAQQLKHLAGIETNTATLHGVKSSLEDIRDKGIRMRR